MTKANEIEILRNAAEQLGDDSYCGPWLASVIDEVEAQIRSDYFPTITPADSARGCAARLQEAADNAKGIVEVAKADAARIMDRAERYKIGVEEVLRSALRNLNAV